MRVIGRTATPRGLSAHAQGGSLVPLLAAAALVAAAAMSAFRPGAAREGSALEITHEQPTPQTPRAGAPAGSRVVRSLTALGGERLRGDTELSTSGGAARVHVFEDTVLDGAGRLVHAEVRASWVGPDGGAEASTRITLDARSGEVVVWRDGTSARRRVSTAEPWAYLPLRTADGRSMSTPVAADVARRAAEAASIVRLVSGDGTDVGIAADQLLATDGDDSWVVLGDDLATFTRRAGRNELVGLRVAALDLEIRPGR